MLLEVYIYCMEYIYTIGSIHLHHVGLHMLVRVYILLEVYV